MKLPEKEWLTLGEVAWVNDPDREKAEVIEELLVKHVFGDSGKPLTPVCKVEDPGVRVLLWRDREDNEPSQIVPGLRLRERQGKFGRQRPPLKGYSWKDHSFVIKGRYFFVEGFSSVKLFGYLRIYMNAETRNSGKTLGMIKLNQPARTPLTDILKRASISRRSPVVRLYYTLPDGSECRVELLGSLEVSERDLLIHLDNMRRFVKGNQAQEKRLEQLISGSSGPEQVTGHNIESSPTIKLPLIDGKEVIPVRLIPLITTPEINPLQLVECLWNPRGDFLKCLNHYPSCGDWELFYKELQAVGNENEKQQLEQFHSGMYVTRSDFEGHEYIVSNAIRLKLDTAIPSPLRTLAYEGFPEDAAVIPQPGIQMPPQKDPVLELRHRLANECRPSPPYFPFDDAAFTVKKYRVPEGKEPVRLAGGAGHIIFVDDTPRHIMAGFEQEAIEKGCIAVEQVEAEQSAVPPAPAAEEVKQVGDGKQTGKPASTKGKRKPRLGRARFWTAVEEWVVSRFRSGKPGITDFRGIARQDPSRFDLNGTIDDYPAIGVDGKYYYWLATDAEVPESTVENRLKEFYEKERIKREKSHNINTKS